MPQSRSRRFIGGMLVATLAGGGIIASGAGVAAAEETAPQIEVGPSWSDTDGASVAAHGGAANAYEEGALDFDVTGDGDKDDLVYLLYGEKKTNATRPVDGVNGYWSTDLENWHSMGTVLPTHQVLPHEVVTVGEGEAAAEYTDIDSITYEKSRMVLADGTAVAYGSTGHPAATQKYTVVSDENLSELKRLGDLSVEDAEAEGVEEQAASSRAFLAPYVTSRDDAGRATGYDEVNLRLGFEYLYGMYNIVERPKMIFNSATNEYVIIFHADGPLNANADRIAWVDRLQASSFGITGGDQLYASGVQNTGSRYGRAQVAFAVADSPFGPFKMVNNTRMNFDRELSATRLGESRDMTVFVDNGKDVNGDGSDDAYVVYSSEINAKMYVSLLSADYTRPVVEGDDAPEGPTTWRSRVLPDNSREASSVFFWDGWYYMLTSGTAGWASSPVIYYRAKSMLQDAPWERIGNPFVGPNPSQGYDSQPTYVLVKNAERGEFIYMGDRWVVDPRTASAGGASKLIWLPIAFTADPQKPLQITGRERWNPDDPTVYRAVKTPSLSYSAVEGDDAGLAAQLPSTVQVSIGTEQATASVTWSADAVHDALLFPGTSTLRGDATFAEPWSAYSGTVITANVTATNTANRAEVALGGRDSTSPPPATVRLGEQDVSVTWDARSTALAADAQEFTSARFVGSATVSGTPTRIIASFTPVPVDAEYVIDTGRPGGAATVLDAATDAGAVLRNAGVADQTWNGTTAGRTWGYSTASTGGAAAGNAADWRSSYVSANYNQPVSYFLTLPAGTYRIGTAQAPRAGASTRIFSAISSGGVELARQTSVSSGEATQIEQTVDVARDGVVKIDFGTDGTSGYNARLALLWVAKVQPELEAEASATTRCVAGKVVVVPVVRNLEQVPMDITLTSSWGTKTSKVDPGKTATAAFSTRAPSLAAGEIDVTISSGPVRQALSAPYPAAECGQPGASTDNAIAGSTARIAVLDGTR